MLALVSSPVVVMNRYCVEGVNPVCKDPRESGVGEGDLARVVEAEHNGFALSLDMALCLLSLPVRFEYI